MAPHPKTPESMSSAATEPAPGSFFALFQS